MVRWQMATAFSTWTDVECRQRAVELLTRLEDWYAVLATWEVPNNYVRSQVEQVLKQRLSPELLPSLGRRWASLRDYTI